MRVHGLGKFVAAVSALAVLAVGGSAVASAAPQAKGQVSARQSVRSHAAVRTHLRAASLRSAREAQGESGSGVTSESDGDAAAQAAACKAAGINPSADNVQYDDQSGTCALDTGANSQQSG